MGKNNYICSEKKCLTLKSVKMNKSELVAAIAKKAEITKVDAEKALNAFMNVTKETLKSKDKVALVGFGTFSMQHRAARKAKNPSNGKTVKVPAKDVAKFKASKVF